MHSLHLRLLRRLFSGNSVQGSFGHTMHLLSAKGFEPDSFQLTRRSLIRRADGLFVESTPDPHHDSILVNLDNVSTSLGSFGMLKEELYHLFARKMRVHSWIFDGASDRAIIPIGRSLFGEFTWENSKDVVFCTKLMKLRSDLPRKHGNFGRVCSLRTTISPRVSTGAYLALLTPLCDMFSSREFRSSNIMLLNTWSRPFPPLRSLGFQACYLTPNLPLRRLRKLRTKCSSSAFPRLCPHLRSL